MLLCGRHHHAGDALLSWVASVKARARPQHKTRINKSRLPASGPGGGRCLRIQRSRLYHRRGHRGRRIASRRGERPCRYSLACFWRQGTVWVNVSSEIICFFFIVIAPFTGRPMTSIGPYSKDVEEFRPRRGQSGKREKSVKKNAALLHFLGFFPLTLLFGVLRGE